MSTIPISPDTQGDVGRAMVVLITDGRANVPLSKANEAEGEPPKEKMAAEELRAEGRRVFECLNLNCHGVC